MRVEYFLIKNSQEKLLDLADFALQEQPEDNLMITIFRAGYIMAYLPWPLSQSNPWNHVFTKYDYVVSVFYLSYMSFVEVTIGFRLTKGLLYCVALWYFHNIFAQNICVSELNLAPSFHR